MRFNRILFSTVLVLCCHISFAQCYLKISSKFDQVVAIGTDSTLWTWGGAHGRQRNYTKPFQIDTNRNWKEVATGEFFAMALKSDGNLWAWGNNIYGELGTGNTSNLFNPTKVTSDSDWVKVSCGKEFTVALKRNGTVWAWGRNDNGQLGQGTNRSSRTSPVQVGSDSNFIDVSAGRFQTLLLKSDSTLWHFGASYTSSIVSQITQVGTTSDWKSIAAGSFECYAIKTDGTLWEFVNKSGRPSGLSQIGTDSDWDLADNSNTYSPEYHALFIKTDGTLWAIGDNRFGQLGTGNLADTTLPVQVGTDNKWTQAVAGKHSSLGLKSDETVWAWGRNNHAQFGNGLNKNSLLPMDSTSTWKRVSVSRGTISGHVLAIHSDGTLWSWGQNNNGQLGLGTQFIHETLPLKVGTDDTWETISTGFHFSVAIKENGTLWGFGRNGKGQLALGSVLTSITSPTQIGLDSNWSAVAAGLEFTMALKENGTLWAWGSNFDGQLGNGSSGSSATQYAPVKIGNDSNWMAIACGDYHTVALKSDSTLWSWGANDKGQLGRSGNRNIPIMVDSTKRFIKIACGSKHTLALASDSTLWVCGYNNLSQLGDSTLSDRSVLTQVSPTNKWIKIIGGTWHSVGIRSDSTLWGWGSNAYGQLGDSTSYVRYPTWLYVPTILSSAKWQDIAGGNYATLAINKAGIMNTMGDRYNNTFQNNYPILGYTQTEPLLVNECDPCIPTFSILSESICEGENYSFGGSSLSSPGTYYDTLINLSGCDSLVTLQLDVTTINDSVSIIGGTYSSTDSNATYQWLDCNNGYSVILNETLQSFTPTVSGNFAVELTKNDCVDTSACLSAIGVGITEIGGSNFVFNVAPNPTSGIVQITASRSIANELVQVLDLQGKLIYVVDLKRHNQEIDLRHLEAGLYIIRYGSISKKLVLF